MTQNSALAKSNPGRVSRRYTRILNILESDTTISKMISHNVPKEKNLLTLDKRYQPYTKIN